MQHEERFPNYLLIWVILLALTGSSIVVSILVKEFAPQLHVALLTFLFLTGAVKTLLVAGNFMNLRFESKWLWILCITALLFVGFFLAGSIVDITATVKH